MNKMGREKENEAMKTIYKYEIPVYTGNNHGVVLLPSGAEILSVGTQSLGGGDERIYLWALVDLAAEAETRHFCVVGTGHQVPPDAERFIGSAHFRTEPLVFHIFEARR